MCYPARQGQAGVAGCAVPGDTAPAQPAVPWLLTTPQLMAPVLQPLHRAAGNEASYHPPVGTGMSPCEYMKDFGIKGLRFPGLYVWLLQNCPACNGVYYSTLPFQICKTGKNNLRKCAGKRIHLAIRTPEICRENPQNFLATHIQGSCSPLPGQSEPLSVTHCSTKQQNINMCFWLQK